MMRAVRVAETLETHRMQVFPSREILVAVSGPSTHMARIAPREWDATSSAFEASCLVRDLLRHQLAAEHASCIFPF